MTAWPMVTPLNITASSTAVHATPTPTANRAPTAPPMRAMATLGRRSASSATGTVKRRAAAPATATMVRIPALVSPNESRMLGISTPNAA